MIGQLRREPETELAYWYSRRLPAVSVPLHLLIDSAVFARNTTSVVHGDSWIVYAIGSLALRAGL